MHTTMPSRAADGSVHVHQYSSHSHSQSAYVPIPMNISSHHNSYAQHSLTSYGAKQQHDTQSHFSHLTMPMSHSYSTSSMQPPSAPFSSSLPTSLSAPIPVRRHTLPHIAYPDYGREESYDDGHSQSYDGSIQSPGSVQSSNERSFSDGEYDAPSSYPNPGLATPFHGASAVIESGVPYNLHHHSRGHAQEGSDGSNSGWRSVAANVIDWSGRAHGGHSRDSSSGSTASNTTAIGEAQPTSVPYTPGMSRTHSDFPITPRSAVSGSYYEPELYDHSHIRSYNQASPTGYYEANHTPNYVLSSSYPSHPYRGSFGSPQAISPVTLFGAQHHVVPKSESLSPELPSYPNMWQTRGGDSNGLQEDDDKDSSVDDGDAKSASPESSLPNTPAAVELALPPVVPSQPFPSDAARVASISPPPHVDFDIQISSNGNVRMPRSCRSTVPVPIPNLTKKSRGRRVPTKPVVIPVSGVGKSARTFTCSVDGCGKCFNRGEHLKRHIRSIHTDEKPHVCPVAKCGKTFSRHDNLCQHMRVHGKFSAPVDGGLDEY